MPDDEALSEKETELEQRLAPHVDGELQAAVAASAGSTLLASYRGGGAYGQAGILDYLLVRRVQRSIARRLEERRGEEPDLPGSVWLAVTADDVCVFEQRPRKKDVQPPPRRWSRSSLKAIEEGKFGRQMRITLTLESGRKAIFGIAASGALRNRVRGALGNADRV
jgi:hypothetical protein